MEAKGQRKRIKEQRTVINEKLIVDAVIKERETLLDEAVPEMVVEKKVVFEELSSLSLTHNRIFRISSLEALTNLKKLVLNGNMIQKIENLDRLVNLEWLDLSFNKISKIEGLDKLSNLKDLSLHQNNISKIEGLEKLEKLQILSLGSNNISSMADVQGLRPYKSLRVLNLKHNPVQDQESYVVSVIAFLPQIQYLDYKLLQPTAAQKAYYPRELDNVLNEEKKNAATIKDTEEKLKMFKEDEKMNVIGLRSMYDDMLTQDKIYESIIQHFDIFAGFKQEVTMKIESEFRKEVEMYHTKVKLLQEEKVEEKAKFTRSMQEARSTGKDKSVELIQVFEKIKAKKIENYYETGNDEELQTLSAEVKKLEGELMSTEMLLVEQTEDIFDEYNSYLRKCKDHSNSIRGEFNMKVGNALENFKLKTEEFIERERERLQEEEGDEEEDEDFEIEADDDEDAFDDEDEEENAAELIKKRVMKTVKDEDKLKEAINGSYESQKEFTEELIALHTRQEAAEIKEQVARLSLENYQQNRSRVTEIFDVVDLYKKVVEMTREEEDEDEDEEDYDDP